MDSKQKVVEWLEKGADYADGCALYNQYGKNKVLQRLFPGREQSYKTKLRYELFKSVGFSILEYNSILEKLNTTSENETGSGNDIDAGNDTGDTGNNGTIIPEIISRITSDYSTLSGSRASLHARMASIEGNDKDSVETRKELSDEIASLSARIEVLYKAKEDYFNLQILPSADELYPPELPDASKKNKAVVLPDTPDELKEFKKKLQVSLCKDRNLLEFQAETKQEQPSPMPEGPKRSKIEKRIVNKEEIIKSIDIKLVELAA